MDYLPVNLIWSKFSVIIDTFEELLFLWVQGGPSENTLMLYQQDLLSLFEMATGIDQGLTRFTLIILQAYYSGPKS